MIVAAEPGLAAGHVSPDHGRRRGPFSTQIRGPVSVKIDIKLFKIGALVQVSVRRIRFALASACPYANEWRLAAARLARGSPA